MADVRADVSEVSESGAQASARSIELVSPFGWSFTLVRITALLAAAAAFFGRLVVPGARGTLQEDTVVLLERVTGTLAYVVVGLVVALLAAGSFELARLHRSTGFFRGLLIGVMSLALAIASPSIGKQLGSIASVALSIAVSVVVICAAVGSMRAPHTRAASIAIAALGLANVGRLSAWALAGSAIENPNPGRYELARVVATFSTTAFIAALGVGTVWLGTRPKLRGGLLAVISLAAAAALTYVALREAEAPTLFLAAVRHALAGAEGAPEPFGMGALAVFALPACVAIALSASLLRSHDAAGPVVALALVSFATFDVPLAALSALAAAIWLPLLAADPRAMWKSIISARKARPALAEAGERAGKTE